MRPAVRELLPDRHTTVTCTASDTRDNTATISFTVTVVAGDTKPPKVCLTLNPGTLWPPNHKMRTIQVILKVTDNEDPTPTCAITNVTSTEPVTGHKYGNTTPDWIFSGLNLQLRAERYSKHGRTYTVTVLCSDDAGNTTTTKGTVRVPHDQGHGSTACSAATTWSAARRTPTAAGTRAASAASSRGRPRRRRRR